MNKILVLALVILFGIPAHAWFENVLIDAVPLKRIVIEVDHRETLPLEVRQCRMHFDALGHMQAFLDCRNGVTSI